MRFSVIQSFAWSCPPWRLLHSLSLSITRSIVHLIVLLYLSLALSILIPRLFTLTRRSLRSLLSGPASRTAAAADLCSPTLVLFDVACTSSVCTCVDVIQHPALVAALPAVVGPTPHSQAEPLSELSSQSLSMSVLDCLSSMTVHHTHPHPRQQ